MTDVAIDCRELSKQYPGTAVLALNKLTLKVTRGEIYGFLGPNGAGKSTTIRTLMNFIQPSAGSASILGLDIVNDSVAVKRHVGYLAGEVALYPRLTGREFLEYMGALQPLKHADYLTKLVKQFQVELDKPIETLSKGNRQKLGLIQAVMHEPDVLILDEPTSGLDPLMQAEFYKLVEDVKAKGAAVFLSSHDLAEVRKMCDRIGFIRNGELITEQTLAELQKTAAHNFDITFKDQAPLAELKKIKGAEVKELTGHAVAVNLKGDLKPLFAVLAKHSVVGLEKHEVNLEEEFMRLYEDPEVGR
jgi:ABC-2 type transport system ATP-binding protein